MDNLGDLLAQRSPQEPPEVAIIKTFVYDQYQVTPTVMVREREIVIGVTSAALAGALRPQLPALKAACATDKRLLLRIT
jgi:hypothetical protein